MSKSRRPQQSVAARLDALYSELPTIECRGACWDSCSSIRMTRGEHRRIRRDTGVDIPRDDTAGSPSVCPALDLLHRCSVYQARPLVCRLWGITEAMPCTFGCVPEGGRLLTDREMHEFMARAEEIAGSQKAAAHIRQPWQRDPQRAAEIMREWNRRRIESERDEAIERQVIINSGENVLYVRGRGQVSSQRPASGANS